MEMDPVSAPSPGPSAPTPARVATGPEPDFADLLQDAVAGVNRLQHEADRAARDYVTGEAQSLHETMIAMEKADIALRFVTQVRNKVVEAYQEVMRMQI